MEWHPIHNSPLGRRVLVWWPMVKIMGNGETADEAVSGQVAVSVQTETGWAVPGSYDADVALTGGSYEFAEKPSHWAELPAGPPGSGPAWAIA